MTSDGTSVAIQADRHASESRKDRVVQELERRGYVADPTTSGSTGGAICRHPSAPSLLVCDDGRLELLSSETDGGTAMLYQPPTKRVHWRRGLLFLVVLGAITFVGLLVVAMIVG